MADKIIYWSKTALTGGGATALDSIDGAGLQDGDIAHVMASGVLYVYLLDADSGAAESSPAVISPYANAGTKRWILQPSYPSSTAVFKSLFDANTILAADADDTPAAVTVAVQQVLGRLTGGNIKGLSATELTALLNAATEALQGAAPLASTAEVIAGSNATKIVTPAGLTAKLDTDGTLAGGLDTRIASQKATKTYADTKVAKALYDANTILAADADDTPAAVTVAEQTLVGRVTGGNIAALTPAQVLAAFCYDRENIIEDLSYLPPVTATWDPGNLVDGAGETSAAIPYPGVALGLFAIEAIAPYDLQGITCNAWVDAANSVKARLKNETTGTIDLASGTWAFQARRI